MDIEHLKYFVVVVNNSFNLSDASKKLHVSQPALSKYILKFESEEGVNLFHRKSGRLTGLTPSGEIFYANAQIVLSSHTDMLKDLREQSNKVKGVVRIGIPPLILTVLFTDIMAKLILLNPLIRFEIIEQGAFDLKRMLALDEVDFAILLSPSDLNAIAYQETIINTDELTAFMSKDHPLASQKYLSWNDLKSVDLAIFNNTFMIHHQLMRKFDAVRIDPKIQLTSGSWDFLLELTKTSELITILPSPIRKHIIADDVLEKHFLNPISWNVILTYPIKTHTTILENYVKNSIVDFFTLGKDISAINDIKTES